MDVLRQPSTERLFSVASCWEIAIKYARGRLPLTLPPDLYLPVRLRSTLTTLLPIEFEHVIRVASLPHLHGDPFDRLLAAQALIQDLPLVTADQRFSEYGVTVIPAL